MKSYTHIEFAMHGFLKRMAMGKFQKIRMDVTLGNNIRSMRKNAGLKQEEVAAKLQALGIDISRSAYSQIECGTYNVRVDALYVMQIIFQCDYNDFFINTQIKIPVDNSCFDK